MATELAKAYVQIIPSAEGITGGISNIISPEASSAGTEAGGILGDNLVGALKGVIAAAGIGIAIKEAIGAVDNFATLGDNIDKMSQKMGMSAQAYQEWDAVMKHSGTTMEAMKGSMKTLANAAENNNEAFSRLGITQEELATLNQEELFERTISSLQNVEDGTERTYLASQVLGRGATELGALLNTSAEDTQRMRDRVHELGGVLSDDAVKNSAAFKDSLQDMQTALSSIGNGIAAEFLPGFTTAMDGVAELFSGNPESGVGMIIEGLGSIGTAIVESVPQIVENMGLIVSGIVSALADSLPDILSKGFEMISNLATGMLENAPQVITNIGEILTRFIGYIMENMPTILQKGFELIANLAQGILNNVPAIITSITSVIANLIATIVSHLPEILAKGIEIITNVCTGIIQSIPDVINAITEIVTNIINKFKETDWAELGIDLITRVAEAIIGAVQKIKDAIADICGKAKDAFLEVDWLSVGSNIIDGVIGGIKDAASGLYRAVKGVVKKALGAAEDEAEIGSPSRLFAREVGQWIPAGIAQGVLDNVGVVEDAMTSMTRSSVNDVEAAMRRTTAGSVAAPTSIHGLEARVDVLTAMLARYLPECAQPSVIDTDSLARTMNRKLGVAYL